MTDKETIKKLRDENKELKKYLIKLTNGFLRCIHSFDKVMQEEESHQRGKALAVIANTLDSYNDFAMHFGLGYSFDKIKKLKEKQNIPNRPKLVDLTPKGK